MNKVREYYLYRHIRLDTNQPFYIGIGVKYLDSSRIYGFRTEYARAFAKEKSRNAHWKNIIKLNPNYKIEILFETSNIEEIIEKEKEFIKLYKDTLCNLTEGGLGIQSFNHTEESKKKIGKSSKRRVRKKGYKLNLSEEGRKSLSESSKNRKISIETRQKISKSKIGNKNGLGHKISEEHKQKLILVSSKTVYQYDLQMNFIKEWKSSAFAGRELGINGNCISKCCRKDLKTYKNFIWSYDKIH